MDKRSTLSQLMFSLIEIWQKSGMTQKEFCAEKEIALPKFQYWMKKYSSRHGGTGDFVAVKVSDVPLPSVGLLEIHLPDGKKLIFHSPVDVSFLKALVS